MRAEDRITIVERQLRWWGLSWHTPDPYLEAAHHLIVNGYATWGDGAFFGILEAVDLDESLVPFLYEYQLSYRRADGQHCLHEIHDHPRLSTRLRFHRHTYCAVSGAPVRPKLPPFSSVNLDEALMELVAVHAEQHKGNPVSLRLDRPTGDVARLLRQLDAEG